MHKTECVWYESRVAWQGHDNPMYTNTALLCCSVLQTSNPRRPPPSAAAVGTGATVRPALVCRHQAQYISYQSAFVSAEDVHPCTHTKRAGFTISWALIYFLTWDWFWEAREEPRLCSLLTELNCVFERNIINSWRWNIRLGAMRILFSTVRGLKQNYNSNLITTCV